MAIDRHGIPAIAYLAPRSVFVNLLGHPSVRLDHVDALGRNMLDLAIEFKAHKAAIALLGSKGLRPSRSAERSRESN
jgi:hypothetical protein